MNSPQIAALLEKLVSSFGSLRVYVAVAVVMLVRELEVDVGEGPLAGSARAWVALGKALAYAVIGAALIWAETKRPIIRPLQRNQKAEGKNEDPTPSDSG